jgi:hypothetical protein
MYPTPEQVRDAAYDRWQRRGGGHGHDRDDWLRAEQDLLFALNYKVVSRIRSEPPPAGVGNGAARGRESGVRVCRFCEQTAPRARFGASAGSGPVATFRPDGTLLVPDECDECRHLFEESFEADFARFAHPICARWAPGEPLPSSLIATPYVPIAAFKGLTRMALACLPRAELPEFEDAIEWIGNPDHDFDAGAFGPLTCDIHIFATPFPAPWATVSLREDDDAPMPFALFHLGVGHALFQIAILLCGRDADLDGHPLVVPRTAPSSLTGRLEDPVASSTIALTSTQATRETRIGRP